MEDIYPVGNLTIKNAISFLNVPECRYATLIKKYPAPGIFDSKLPKGIIDVVVDSHAYERWNQRVGPITPSEILTNIFKVAVLINPNRIHVLDRELAILDNDIVFSFEFENSILKVTTFFGRISLKPLLSNVDILRRYNVHYNEEVDLHIDNCVIDKQVLPITPTSVIEYIDSENISHIFYYIKSKDSGNQNRNFFYHLIRNADLIGNKYSNDLVSDLKEIDTKIDEQITDDILGEYIIKIIDMSHPSKIKLTDMQLHVLGLLGNIRFLLKYMSQEDTERINKLHDTHSRTAIRRFAGNKNWNFLKKSK